MSDLAVILGAIVSLGIIVSALVKFGRRAIDWANRQFVEFRLRRKPLLERLLAMGIEERFARRAIERGLTDADVRWNARLGRPPHWIETVNPAEELQRREDYRRKHPSMKD
jgi:hypothetical protein